MTAPPLTFLAPPSFGEVHDDGSPDVPAHTSLTRSTGDTARSRQMAATVRMTRGARGGCDRHEAGRRRHPALPRRARRRLPDEKTPSRTRFRRGELVILAGADGMVLRVDRRSR